MLKNICKCSLFLTIIILGLSLALPQSLLHAQNNLRIYEDIGGGSGTGTTSDNSDNTFIYVAGGLLIAGIVAYALFLKKNNKQEEESDSTQAFNTLTPTINKTYSNSLERETSSLKDSFPVDILLGIRRDDNFISDKTYLVGVSVRF